MLAIGRRQHNIGNVAKFGMLLGALTICSVVSFGAIKASEPSTWMSPASITAQTASQEDLAQECDEVPVPAVMIGDDREKDKKQKTHTFRGCVTEGKDVSLAAYRDKSGTARWAIKARSDTYYRVIVGASEAGKMRLMPGTNRLVYMSYTGGYVYGTITTIENALTGLTPESTSGTGYVDHYILDDAKAKKWLGYNSGDGIRYMPAYSTAFSPNGRYMIAWISYVGYVKIDFETSKVTEIGRFPGAWYGGEAYNPVAAAISSDGRYAFIQDGLTVVDTENCGREVTRELLDSGNIFNGQAAECRRSQLYYRVADYIGYNGYGSKYRWNYDESALEFFVQPYPYSTFQFEKMKVSIRLSQETGPKLEYLAMGDSFSSGEGDTERLPDSDNKYYREFTDTNGNEYQKVPKEKCHLSSRSYPYMLANGMGLGSPSSYSFGTRWQTIACSGATAWDVKSQGSPEYLGQGDRLKGTDYKDLKSVALDRFIPGRHKQVEFVSEYKPKAITITMGGNDIGFGGKLSACVQDGDTCMFAKHEWRDKLKNEIENQYSNLSEIYKEIISASDGSVKLYVIGYPQIINGNPGAPCKSTFNLNSPEREMVSNSIVYLNNIIEQAASASGAKYIDVENAFGDHMICGASDYKYVNAIVNVLGINGNEMAESFHPNAIGHAEIANNVWERLDYKKLQIYDHCPDTQATFCPDFNASKDAAQVPPYFNVNNSNDDERFVYYTLTNGTLVIDELVRVGSSYKYKPGSEVKLVIYSDPIELVDVRADQNGNIDMQFHLPASLPLGFHTLVLSGTSFSGEAIELYQVVEVKDSSSNENKVIETGVESKDNFEIKEPNSEPKNIPDHFASTEARTIASDDQLDSLSVIRKITDRNESYTLFILIINFIVIGVIITRVILKRNTK